MMTDVIPIVHLVDDDERVLVALKRLLAVGGHRVMAHLSAEDFLEHSMSDAPGCAVVDLGLPGIDGLGLQDALGSKDPAIPIIFLTGCADIASTVQAMKAGAVDFLTKPVNARLLLAAVAQALSQDAYTRRAKQERLGVEEKLNTLTPREREVFGSVVAGRLNKQIAADLGTVEKTVKVHRGRMMEKMKVRTVADLVRLATIARL
jgi:FixJ family two-component response regulator